MDPATAIIRKLGGEAKVAEITGLAFTAPYRWQHGKSGAAWWPNSAGPPSGAARLCDGPWHWAAAEEFLAAERLQHRSRVMQSRLGAGALRRAAAIAGAQPECPFGNCRCTQREIPDLVFPQCHDRPRQANGPCRPATHDPAGTIVGGAAAKSATVRANSMGSSSGGVDRSWKPSSRSNSAVPTSIRTIFRWLTFRPAIADTPMAATRKVSRSPSAVIPPEEFELLRGPFRTDAEHRGCAGGHSWRDRSAAVETYRVRRCQPPSWENVTSLLDFRLQHRE